MRLKTRFFGICAALTGAVVIAGVFPLALAQEASLAPHLEGRVLAQLAGSGTVVSVRTAGQSPTDAVANLRRLPAVDIAELDFTYRASVLPNDPAVPKQWYLAAARLPEAWEFSKGAPSAVIAVLDSGVDLTHPDLKDRIWTDARETPGNGLDDDRDGYVDDAHGWDFVDGDNDPDPVLAADGNSEGINHGTLVAGAAAAAGNNSEGIAGAAWNVRVMPLRVLDSRGVGSTLAVVNAVRYAVAHGTRIINISFAGTGYSQILAATLRDAVRAGAVIVAAAGNEGDTERGGNLNARPAYPVCYRGLGNEPIIIGVAAVDATGRRSSFTSYGSDCVSLSAPGENFYLPQVWRPALKGYEAAYGAGWSGSSLSAPLVAGTAALLLSMNPGLTPAEIQTLLTSRAASSADRNPGDAAALGAGLLDAGASVLAAQEAWLSGGTTAARPAQPTVTAVPSYQVQPLFAVASGSRKSAAVSILKHDFSDYTGFDTYARSTAAPPSVALADFNGDGEPSVVVGAPPGEAPTVRIFTKVGILATQFMAFGSAYRGGVNVAVGDLDGDGREEIAAAPASAAAPQVRLFEADGKFIGEFLAGGTRERVGLRLAVIDTDSDGLGEIAVAPAGAGARQVRLYGTDGKLRLFFEPFGRAYRGGFELAAGDLNGDGLAELVVGAGAGGPPRVSVFDRQGRELRSFLAFDKRSLSGITVGTVSTGGSESRILVGLNGSGELRRFTLGGTLEKAGRPLGSAFRGGLRPAGLGLPPTRK